MIHSNTRDSGLDKQLGSVAGSVIQATGKLEFEDGRWLLLGYGGCLQPQRVRTLASITVEHLRAV